MHPGCGNGEICNHIKQDETLEFFPKQFTVGVLNAVLSVSALAGMLCPPP